jgi:hypothetical protein
MIRTTWRALQTFSATADAYLKRTGAEKTKLCYAIKRVLDQLAKPQEQIQIELSDIEIDLCVVDDKGVITRDAGGHLQFTRETIKDRNKRQRALLERESIEVEPYFVDPVPDDLTELERAAFAGLIIRPAAPDDGNGDHDPI